MAKEIKQFKVTLKVVMVGATKEEIKNFEEMLQKTLNKADKYLTDNIAVLQIVEVVEVNE